MRSDGHLWATVNYIHHNPVKHGYVTRWDEWPFSSASAYLNDVGRDEAAKIWNDFPMAIMEKAGMIEYWHEVLRA